MKAVKEHADVCGMHPAKTAVCDWLSPVVQKLLAMGQVIFQSRLNQRLIISVFRRSHSFR
jgi:hypothetical protein